MTLLTIDDLNRHTPESMRDLVLHAQSLSKLWQQWKAQHDGKMVVPVEFFGERERKPGVHASELSGCLRKLVYALQATQRIVLADEKDVNMQRRFDQGTLVHAIIQHEFKLMCEWLNNAHGRLVVTFEDEVRIYPELGGYAAQYHIHSSMDGLFTFWYQEQQPDGTVVDKPYLRVGLEIKTASDKEYAKLKEPKEEHMEQTCLYMATLNLPLMWTLYYNKSSSFFTQSDAPWLFKYNRALWEHKLEPRIIEAYKMAQADNLPKREEGMPCGWCPFGWKCQPIYLQRGRTYATVNERDFF